jgi:hypothetical protein
MLAAESLEKIDPGNPKAIEALIKVLETTPMITPACEPPKARENRPRQPKGN